MDTKLLNSGYVKVEDVLQMLNHIQENYQIKEEVTTSPGIEHYREKLQPKSIQNIASLKKDGTLWSPEDALFESLKEIGVRGAFKNGDKILVLALNDSDGYQVSFVQAGMAMSQCLALCDVAKAVFLREMEYV